jgi:hypothetical protein
MILPKLWLAYIQKYWERFVPDPTTYPITTSKFSIDFDAETADVIKTMEANLNTEESIITSEMVPEGRRVGAYLGTYDVTGEEGKEVLVSPEPVPEDATDIIVFHYRVTDDGEEGGGVWEVVDTAVVKDGFVYATIDSFSPIAVFVLKPAPYYVSSLKVNGVDYGKTFVANGTPISVTEEDGKLYITDCFGEKKEYDVKSIVAGTVDGTPIKSTRLSIANISSVNFTAYGSSLVPDADTKFIIDEINITKTDCSNNKALVKNAQPNVVVKTLNVYCKNSDIYYIGTGDSIVGGKDLNGEDITAIGPSSPSRTVEANITLEDCSCYIFYGGGINGRYYTQKSNVVAKNCQFGDYFCAGGSNGRVEDIEFNIENSSFGQFETTNRGSVGTVKANLKNCTGTNFYCGGDSTASDVEGTVEKVGLNFTGGEVTLGRGTTGGQLMTKEQYDEIVDYVKITASTVFNYREDSDKAIIEVTRRQR